MCARERKEKGKRLRMNSSRATSTSAHSSKMGDTNPTAIPAAPIYAGKENNEGTAPEAGEAGGGGKRSRNKIVDTFRSRLAQVVSHEEATIPLAWQALNTGLVDALIYSKSQIWTGFQTGVCLARALALMLCVLTCPLTSLVDLQGTWCNSARMLPSTCSPASSGTRC